MARKPSPAIKAAADRAEKRAKGETITTPAAPIDPVIIKAADLPKPRKPDVHFSQDLANEICDWIADGASLRAFCRQEHAPSTTSVKRWLRQHDDFRTQYARAREDQADTHADEIVDLADSCDDVNKARLQIDARKWVAAKLKPKKYGDFQKVEHEIGFTAQFEDFVRTLDAGRGAKVIEHDAAE